MASKESPVSRESRGLVRDILLSSHTRYTIVSFVSLVELMTEHQSEESRRQVAEVIRQEGAGQPVGYLFDILSKIPGYRSLGRAMIADLYQRPAHRVPLVPSLTSLGDAYFGDVSDATSRRWRVTARLQPSDIAEKLQQYAVKPYAPQHREDAPPQGPYRNPHGDRPRRY